MRFQGRTALITGSSEGIGRTTALRLVEEGGAVAVNGRNAVAVDVVVDEIRRKGGRAIPASYITGACIHVNGGLFMM